MPNIVCWLRFALPTAHLHRLLCLCVRLCTIVGLASRTFLYEVYAELCWLVSLARSQPIMLTERRSLLSKNKTSFDRELHHTQSACRAYKSSAVNLLHQYIVCLCFFVYYYDCTLADMLTVMLIERAPPRQVRCIHTKKHITTSKRNRKLLVWNLS